MKMTASDIATYPKFAHYVQHDFPRLIHVKLVVHNLKTEGSLTDAQIRHALVWGADPMILITDLSHGQCGVPSAYGCTRKASPDQIEIDEGTVKDFERSPYALGVGKNATGTNVFIVGATLLHELCHLGNYGHRKAERTEAGFAFETATYGKSIP